MQISKWVGVINATQLNFLLCRPSCLLFEEADMTSSSIQVPALYAPVMFCFVLWRPNNKLNIKMTLICVQRWLTFDLWPYGPVIGIPFSVPVSSWWGIQLPVEHPLVSGLPSHCSSGLYFVSSLLRSVFASVNVKIWYSHLNYCEHGHCSVHIFQFSCLRNPWSGNPVPLPCIWCELQVQRSLVNPASYRIRLCI